MSLGGKRTGTRIGPIVLGRPQHHRPPGGDGEAPGKAGGEGAGALRAAAGGGDFPQVRNIFMFLKYFPVSKCVHVSKYFHVAKYFHVSNIIMFLKYFHVSKIFSCF